MAAERDNADNDSLSGLFAFSLPVHATQSPDTPSRPQTRGGGPPAFGQATTFHFSHDQAQVDNPFTFDSSLDRLDHRREAVSYDERPKTARPPTAVGSEEAIPAFGSSSRPSTASAARPSTAGFAAPPPFVSSFSAYQPALVEEDEDDDCGMFSFHRPATGEEPPPGSMIPLEEVLQQQGFDFMRNAQPNQSQPKDVDKAVEVGIRAETAGQPSMERQDASVPTSPPTSSVAGPRSRGQPAHDRRRSDATTRKRARGVWHLPGSSHRVTSDPFDVRLFGRQDSTGIDGSDEIDHKNLSPGLGDQTIPLAELSLRARRTSSLDDKGRDEEAGAQTGNRTRRRQPREDSAYPEVQASVSNIDDPIACVLTLRVWFLGFTFCIVFAALNTFFSLRYPAPLITPIITQLFAYPLGRFLARYASDAKWKLPAWTQQVGLPETVSLNPGPFSIKEHALLTIMANVATGPALALNYSIVAEKFYGQHPPFGFDLLLVLTTQMIGFGAAGLCRRLLVWPASMLWPQNLVYCTLLNTFHAEIEDEEPGPTRLRFFTYVFAGAFCWYWLPGFLFVGLSAFSWVCWIAPTDLVVNQLFGVASGLGMGLFTFDWSQIAYLPSPLVVPWWAQLNVFLGFVVMYWVVAPAIYYSNAYDTAYLPMLTSSVFDRFGMPYNTSRVLDTTGLHLNVTAYAEYSPVYMPVGYLINYGTGFMLAVGILVHTALFNGRDIWRRLLRREVKGDVDIHMKLMRNYADVPDWAYLLFLLIAFALSAVTVACWPTGMPVWALLISVALGALYVVPAGYVYALTSYNVSINLISELLGGYLTPTKPLANILFKLYTSNVLNLGLLFAQDLKFGHYMKIPPRDTFKVQVVAVFVTACVQVGVKRWLISVVPTLCEPDQSAQLICPGARTVFSSSILWGLIGPARLFDAGAYYHTLIYWSFGGLAIPLAVWLLINKWPKCFLRYFHFPTALTGLTLLPPATGINYTAPIMIGFVFQYLIRRKNFDWWSKYNFVLSAAMDAGTVLCGILIFFSLQLPRHGTISVEWWGNTVFQNTLDWIGVSYKTPPTEGFGRIQWA